MLAPVFQSNLKYILKQVVFLVLLKFNLIFVILLVARIVLIFGHKRLLGTENPGTSESLCCCK